LSGSLEFPMRLQQHAQSAGVHEVHTGHVDSEVVGSGSGQQGVAQEWRGVGVDLSAGDDAVWGSLDAQSSIFGGHGADGIDA
jgi:hypothetical protein